MTDGIMQRVRLRAHKKLRPLVPIILGALLVLGVMIGLMSLSLPYLPQPYQDTIRLVQNGDWTTGRAQLTAMLDGFGTTQSVAFITLQILQVLLAPIPGQLLGLLGGYLFGFWHGLGLTMLGLTIGSGIALGLARLFGEQIVRRLVPESIFARFDSLVREGGLWNFFLIFLLPALPDDAVCLLAGLTRLPLAKLLLVCVVGRLPGMAVLTFVGANVGTHPALANVLLSAALGVAIVLWFFSEEVEVQVSALLPRRGKS